MSALRLAPALSALQLLQSGILSLQPHECVPAPTPSALTPKPTISSRPSNTLSAFLLRLVRLRVTIVSVYRLYSLTYLLT